MNKLKETIQSFIYKGLSIPLTERQYIDLLNWKNVKEVEIIIDNDKGGFGFHNIYEKGIILHAENFRPITVWSDKYDHFEPWGAESCAIGRNTLDCNAYGEAMDLAHRLYKHGIKVSAIKNSYEGEISKRSYSLDDIVEKMKLLSEGTTSSNNVDRLQKIIQKLNEIKN